MKIALCSDLHLEMADLPIENTEEADVLILAGDILTAEQMHDHPLPVKPYSPGEIDTLGYNQILSLRYRDFIKKCSEEFPEVVVIAGNHEFYRGRWSASISHLREEYSRYKNIHLLERDTWFYKDILFLGATLWTDMNRDDPVTLHSISGMLNDYHMIRNDECGFTKLRPAHTVARHRKTVEYFKSVLDGNKSKKTVVISHHAPSSLSIDERYRGDIIMNGAYFSDLSEVILDNPQISIWCHGHTHTDFDYQIGDTRVVCHPRGYCGYERGAQDVDPYYPKIIEV